MQMWCVASELSARGEQAAALSAAQPLRAAEAVGQRLPADTLFFLLGVLQTA
jgi:hypothetical protein